MPASAGVAATTRALVESEPALVKSVVAVFDDLSATFAERPADAKAAIARLFPEVDAKTLDLVFALESKSFAARILTQADIEKDVAYIRASGLDFGAIDKVDPSSVLYKR
jgi:hypothetical protein